MGYVRERLLSKRLKMLLSLKGNAPTYPRDVERFGSYSVNLRVRGCKWHIRLVRYRNRHEPVDGQVTDGIIHAKIV